MLQATSAEEDESEGQRAMINKLKNLGLSELGEVEFSLDEAFNIFSGLVASKKVTVATGTAQSTARAPAITSVITAQDIEATGAATLEEALQAVPGLHVSRSNIGYNPIYTIRGIHSEFNPEVLMLINGIPINTLYAGNRGQAWGEMPVNSIARVEIIRGPGSAVYGADAFAGVINIITKTKADIARSEAGARGGSFNSGNAWATHGDTWGDFDVAMTLEYGTSGGADKIVQEDIQTSLDRLYGTSASLAPGEVELERGDSVDARLDISRDEWQFRAGYQGRRDLGMGAGGNQALDPNGRFSDDRVNADITYHDPKFAKHWDVTAQASYLHTNWRTTDDLWLFPPGAFGGTYPDGFIGNPGTAEHTARLDLSAFYSGFANHTARIGAGYHYGDLYKVRWSANNVIDPATGMPTPLPDVVDFSDSPNAFMIGGIRKNRYLFAQDAWAFNADWELTAGLRYDHYSDFGSTVNPRLALVWQATPDLVSKFLYGRAFRAPSFLELYGINNPVALGNPDLEAEQIQTEELAFDYRAADNLNLAINLFHYEITDGIRFLPQEQGGAVAQNAASQDGYGAEFEARWKVTKTMSLVGNFAWQNSTDQATDSNAGNAPTYRAYLRADWLLLPMWYLNAQLNSVWSRERVAGDPREGVDDYTTLDLTLRYKDVKQGGWNLALGVKNLFDTEVYEPSLGPNLNGIIGIPYDLPMPGRSVWLEGRYLF
jgi:iron complex outermembrane receptor protein